MLISNIQRFCLHDGPGIRTTVFFMGCSARCFWCSNPENLTHEIKLYKKNNVTYSYGKKYETEEVFNIITKDKDYYVNNGGVTFSGGECLLYLCDNIELLKKLTDENISICVETSLSVPKENLIKVMEYIDFFIADLKVFTNKSKLINLNPDYVKQNLELLKPLKNKVTFRIPLVKNFNNDLENLQFIKQIIHSFQPNKVEIFQVHNLGKEKYLNLNQIPPKLEKFSNEELSEIKDYLSYANTEILQI